MPKKPSLSIVNVYDRHNSGAPGLQRTHLLPSRSQLRSNKALGDRDGAQSPTRRELLQWGVSSELTTSWVQSPKPQLDRIDGSLKAGSILGRGRQGQQGYQGRAKMTSARRRALSSSGGGSRYKVMNELINLPEAAGPRQVIQRSQKKTLSNGTTTTMRAGSRRHVSPVIRLRRPPEYETFHHSKPLRQQHESHGGGVGGATSGMVTSSASSLSHLTTEHRRGDEEIVDEVVEEMVQDVVHHAFRTLQPLTTRTTRTAYGPPPLTVKLPLPEKSATRATSPTSAARAKRFIGIDNVAGGGGFVSSGWPLPNPIHADTRPVGCLLEVREMEDLLQETGGGRGFVGGRIGSARPGSPVKNVSFTNVRSKGERLVGGGFSASMLPSSPDYPRLCSSRTMRERESLLF